jgi:hypothetical protein
MVRFHIGVNFLGGGAAVAVDVDVDEEEEGTGFAVFVEFAVVAVTDEEPGTRFALGVLLFQEFAGGLSLIGLLDSEFG